ncbi:hypothetical protein Tco_0751368 [Tanacetum coccineum]|uniref:Uncharacterized protein n=1 Tax=Tanacetum coccineum TaxID=301880 RepID=A0ABQ4Z4Q1_9ASTR
MSSIRFIEKHIQKQHRVEVQHGVVHLAITDKIDWTNPERSSFHNDLSKPLPLVGPPSRKTIPTRYLFNHDLEYLRHGNEEKKYALLVTKVKAARYEQEGIEELIPHLLSPSIHKYDINAELEVIIVNRSARGLLRSFKPPKRPSELEFENLYSEWRKCDKYIHAIISSYPYGMCMGEAYDVRVFRSGTYNSLTAHCAVCSRWQYACAESWSIKFLCEHKNILTQIP